MTCISSVHTRLRLECARKYSVPVAWRVAVRAAASSHADEVHTKRAALEAGEAAATRQQDALSLASLVKLKTAQHGGARPIAGHLCVVRKGTVHTASAAAA